MVIVVTEVRYSVLILPLAGLGACTHSADLYPSNQAATVVGIPKMVYTSRMGGGPVTVNMPDGEVLTGRYAMTDDGEAVATGFSGTHTATAFAFAGGRPVEVGATDGKTTIHRDGSVNMSGGGTGECQIEPSDAMYRLVF